MASCRRAVIEVPGTFERGIRKAHPALLCFAVEAFFVELPAAARCSSLRLHTLTERIHQVHDIGGSRSKPYPRSMMGTTNPATCAGLPRLSRPTIDDRVGRDGARLPFGKSLSRSLVNERRSCGRFHPGHKIQGNNRGEDLLGVGCAALCQAGSALSAACVLLPFPGIFRTQRTLPCLILYLACPCKFLGTT
jgi:hypothetical protein